jgi:hypothetical protein
MLGQAVSSQSRGENCAPKRWGGRLHLRVEDAGRRLHNGDGLVVDGDGVEGALLVLEHGYKLQADVLGVHLGREAVRQRLLLAAGDRQSVALAGEVAQDLRLVASILDQRAADEVDGDGLGLLVGDGQTSLGRMAVDQLDAEDLRLREAGRDGHLQIGRLGLVVDDSVDIFDLGSCVSGLMSCGVSRAGPHLDGCEGIKRAQREDAQRRELPGDHGGGRETGRAADACRREREREMGGSAAPRGC